MRMTTPLDPELPDAPPAVPRDSSPTWELEMLVSGGVIFSLFQVPPVIDAMMRQWQPHATYEAGFALMMLYAYAKGAVYILIAGFVLHLGVRAYWVGLVGLNSVYAGGVQWDKTQLGPIAQEVYRRKMPALPRIIARLDNFASIIFSFAFLIVIVTLVSIAIMAVLFGLTLLAARLFGAAHLRWFATLFVVLFAVPPMVVAYLDKKRGARIEPESRLGRVMRRLTGIYYHTQLVGLLGPVLFTISTNGRRRATYALFYVVMIGSLYLVLGEYMVRQGMFSVNGADYFSTSSNAHSVQFGHYESQWAEGVGNTEPSIQADIVREPFVRLFIPYQPVRHNPGVAARCPGVPRLEPRGVQMSRPGRARQVRDSLAQRALDCLATMHAVRVNDSLVRDVRFRFATHPASGVDGIVAYLPTVALPRGENVLTVMPPPRRPGSTNRRPVEAWVIPFWL